MKAHIAGPDWQPLCGTRGRVSVTVRPVTCKTCLRRHAELEHEPDDSGPELCGLDACEIGGECQARSQCRYGPVSVDSDDSPPAVERPLRPFGGDE